MRDARELEHIATAAIRISAGAAPVAVLAIDDEEERWFVARLKGRHGVKHIGIRRGAPGEAMSIADRFHGGMDG